MGYFSPSGGSAGGGGVPTDVNILPTGTVKSIFSTALAVASNSTETILTYTVPGGSLGYMLVLEMSGTSIADYDVTLNGVPYARYRTYWSGPFQIQAVVGTSVLDAYPLLAGDVLTINVTNFRSDPNDFEARLQYIET